MDYSRYKRADYTRTTIRRPASSHAGLDGVALPDRPIHSRPARAQDAAASLQEEMVISIHINLPDYNQWRTTRFARQYPFFSIIIAFIGLLLFLGAIESLVALWHATHKPKPILEDMFNLRQVIRWM